MRLLPYRWQDDHCLVWHWPSARKPHRIRIKAETDSEPLPVRLVASTNQKDPTRRASIDGRSSKMMKLRHRQATQTFGKGWGWSVPFPLQLVTSDELLHVKSRYSSLTTDADSSGVHAFEPLIFTVEQEVIGGVHFVKFARGRPHEMLTHIYNDTEQEVLVRQASAPGQKGRPRDVVPAMGSIPFSLDDPWGPRSLELCAGNFLTGAASDGQDGEGGDDSVGWQISFSLEHIFTNRLAQPLAPKKSAAEAPLAPAEDGDLESGGGSRVGLRSSSTRGAPQKSMRSMLSLTSSTETDGKERTKAEAPTVRHCSALARGPSPHC